MSRPPRLYAPNLIYHIYIRGNNKQDIFFEDSDYIKFLKNLERFRKQFQYRIYAYCLLPNHFHLLIRVGNIHLSKIMQVMMTAYTMYFNKKHDRIGHLFQGRFQSIVVDKDEYLLQVLRYIHLNPVKGGFTNSPQSYRWSSYASYLIHLTQKSDMPIVERREILEMFSQNEPKQKKLFHEFTIAGIDSEFDPVRDQVRGVLGGDLFRRKLTKVSKGVRP